MVLGITPNTKFVYSLSVSNDKFDTLFVISAVIYETSDRGSLSAHFSESV